MGAPFEGYRGVYDLDFYSQDMSAGAEPNDDLDLQLIWLNAAEKFGRGLKSTILGDYWLTYIVGNWSEYGAGKMYIPLSLFRAPQEFRVINDKA